MSETERNHRDSTVPAVDVGRYVRALKRWALLIIAAGVVGAAVGTMLLPSKTYTSRAVVQVEDGIISLATPTGSNPPNMSTEQQVATGFDVLAVAADADRDHPDVSSFQHSGKVSVPLNSTTLVFTYAADSGKAAQNGALAWANAYLTQRTTDLQSQVDVQTQQATQRRDTINGQVRALQRQLSDLTPGTLAYTVMQTKLRGKNSELSSAQRSINQLAQADIDAGHLVGGPQRPRAPSGISSTVGLLLGAATGLFIGIALALVVERFSRKVRDGHDLARATSVGVWGVLGPGGEGAQLQIEALGARVALLARHHRVQSMLITGLKTRYAELARSLSSTIDRLGVPIRVTDDIESLLDGSDDPGGDQDHDLVLVDGPPVLIDPRTAVYSSEAHITLLVVGHRSATVEEVREAVQRISAAGGAVTGVVMVARRRRRLFGALPAKAEERTPEAGAHSAGYVPGPDPAGISDSAYYEAAAAQEPSAASETGAETAGDELRGAQAGRNGSESSHWSADHERARQFHGPAGGAVPIKRKGTSSPSRERRSRD